MNSSLQSSVNRHLNPRYSERAVWRCKNRHSGRVHIIHGPLAEILIDYPEDYRLRYLFQESIKTPKTGRNLKSLSSH